MDDLDPEPGEPAVLPDVGDTVILLLTEEHQRKMYKVLTRNFSYSISDNMRSCFINIVVTDVDSEEIGARLKE